MFSMSEIEHLQPPDIAEVLQRWQRHVEAKFDASTHDYDSGPTLLGGQQVAVLSSLCQQFVTAIPNLKSQRLGWPHCLADLVKALKKAELLK